MEMERNVKAKIIVKDCIGNTEAGNPIFFVLALVDGDCDQALYGKTKKNAQFSYGDWKKGQFCTCDYKHTKTKAVTFTNIRNEM